MVTSSIQKTTITSTNINSAKEISIPARKTSHPPVIDGKLDDPAWHDAAVIKNFTQFVINEGQPATEETTVFIVYDDEKIYFGIKCSDRDPSKIRANFSTRDKISGDDQVNIYLDPFFSKRRAYVFGINPYGIQYDGFINENDYIDIIWDAIFESKGTINENGWTAEIAIPFKSLRFPEKEKQDWGILITRYLPRENEYSSWPPLSKEINGYIQQSGKLTGLGIKPPRVLEFTPYFSGGYQEEFNKNFGRWSSNKVYDLGLDFKYGPIPNLIFDFTINPDFSQVEADIDQIEINRRYESYYPEKRPFFLEGAEKFKTPIQVFYSRRIYNPLLGTKITGKVDQFNLGFISVWDEGIKNKPDQLVNILRIQKDLENQSNVGLIFVDREYKIDNSFKYNRVFGLDTRVRFSKYYTLTLQSLASWTTNKEVSSESSEPAISIDLTRNDGKLYLDLYYLDIAPNFSAEVGYLKEKDIRQVFAYAHYIFQPETWLRRWSPFAFHEATFNHQNILNKHWSRFGTNFDFKKNTFLGIYYDLEEETWREVKYLKNNFGLSLANNLSKYFSVTLSYLMGKSIYYDMEHFSNPEDQDDSYLGWRYNLSLTSELKPNSNLNIFLSANWENFRKGINEKEIYEIWLLRGKIHYQISPSWFLRTIVQGNTFNQTLRTYGLLGFVPSAGTVFYLGYNEEFSFEKKSIPQAEQSLLNLPITGKYKIKMLSFRRNPVYFLKQDFQLQLST